MSMGEWYRYKAVQCARLAQDASDPDRARRYEEEEKTWRQLADQIEAEPTSQTPVAQNRLGACSTLGNARKFGNPFS
jgi:hypothetical protein